MAHKIGDGFFSLEQYQRTPKSRVMSIAGCGSCKLHKKCYTPKMEPTGKGKKGILVIAEAPGETEDRRGVQLVGKAGKYTRARLKEVGIDLDRDCRKINAINCRPPDNATPTKAQIEYCRPNVIAEIKRFKPKMIIALGGQSVRSILAHRLTEDAKGDGYAITRWRGFIIPDREWNAWICPAFHPSYVQRMEGNKAVEKIFKSDLQTISHVIHKASFPTFKEEKDLVEVIQSEKEARIFLRQLLKKPPRIASFDYETTGLKPHAPGHEIVTCSISTTPFNAFSFNVTDRVKPLLCKFLTHPKIYKIAANLKFEEIWSRVRLGVKVSNWLWDTMLASHCLDNRKKITGLKFQAYVRYGIIDYDSHISPFLKSKDSKNGNAMNTIHQAPRDELLLYNGIDSMLELRLAFDQMKEMGILDPPYFATHGKKRRIE